MHFYEKIALEIDQLEHGLKKNTTDSFQFPSKYHYDKILKIKHGNSRLPKEYHSLEGSVWV